MSTPGSEMFGEVPDEDDFLSKGSQSHSESLVPTQPLSQDFDSQHTLDLFPSQGSSVDLSQSPPVTPNLPVDEHVRRAQIDRYHQGMLNGVFRKSTSSQVVPHTPGACGDQHRQSQPSQDQHVPRLHRFQTA